MLLDSRQKAEAEFDGDFKMTFHLAPPTLGTKGANGRPAKKAFGEWFLRPLKILTKLKALRGTPLDVFGYTAERKMERALIRQYEQDMKEVLAYSVTRNHAMRLRRLPLCRLDIRGFGPVLVANEAKAAKRREDLLAVIRDGGPVNDGGGRVKLHKPVTRSMQNGSVGFIYSDKQSEEPHALAPSCRS